MQMQMQMHVLVKIGMLVSLLVIGAACADEPAIEPDFGLGAKADLRACDPVEELCWPSVDVAIMQSILVSEIDIALDYERSYRHLTDVFDGLDRLAYKLTDKELDSLAQLRLSDSEPEEILPLLQEQVLQGLKSRYYATYMIGVGQHAEGGNDDKSDSRETTADYFPGKYSEAVRASLVRLNDSGVAGGLYANMLTMSGVLDRDYNGTVDIGAPSGISQEEAANDIVIGYKRAAALIGLGMGAVSLLPIYGLIVTIPLDAFITFSMHTRMTFELSDVYGWDMNEGTELFTMTMFMFSDGEFNEVIDNLAGSSTMPNLVRGISSQVGVNVSVPLAVKVSSKSIFFLIKALVVVGKRMALKSVAAKASAALASQVLGWVTGGLAVVGSALVDYYITDRIGEHVKVVGKRWLVDMPQEGQLYLNARSNRDCFFSALSSIAHSDGTVSSREQALFMAYLDKNYYEGNSTWYQLSPQEQSTHARTLATGVTPTTCLKPSFGSEFRPSRLSVVSHLFSMMAIDEDEDDKEESLYRSYVASLSEAAAWNDTVFDDHVVAYMERVVHSTVNPTETDVPEEYIAALQRLTTENMLPFLETTSQETTNAFDCGFSEQCF